MGPARPTIHEGYQCQASKTPAAVDALVTTIDARASLSFSE